MCWNYPFTGKAAVNKLSLSGSRRQSAAIVRNGANGNLFLVIANFQKLAATPAQLSETVASETTASPFTDTHESAILPCWDCVYVDSP